MATSKLKFTRTTTDKLTVKGGVLSEDCHELTKHFDDVYLASASGNHSRLQAKDLAQHSERLDAFIAWDVCRVLQHIDGFHSLLDCSIDDGIAKVDIYGKDYLLIHGDYDAPTKQGYAKSFRLSTPYAPRKRGRVVSNKFSI